MGCVWCATYNQCISLVEIINTYTFKLGSNSNDLGGPPTLYLYLKTNMPFYKRFREANIPRTPKNHSKYQRTVPINT